MIPFNKVSKPWIHKLKVYMKLSLVLNVCTYINLKVIAYQFYRLMTSKLHQI